MLNILQQKLNFANFIVKFYLIIFFLCKTLHENHMTIVSDNDMEIVEFTVEWTHIKCLLAAS